MFVTQRNVWGEELSNLLGFEQSDAKWITKNYIRGTRNAPYVRM